MNELPFHVRAEVFLRSLLIQSGWNYRTMIGSGIAFAMIPVLRYLRRFREDATPEERLAHYGAHFNAHPYLASAAIGSLSRMEVDGESGEKIARFRDAVRGPLGALGDRLVWAAWLPLCSLIALAVYWAGAPPWVAVGLFLGVYNAGHLVLRIWGFRTGWDAGAGLGRRLREAHLPNVTHRVERLLPTALGLVIGAGIGSGGGGVTGGTEAWVVAAGGVATGVIFGPRAWKPAAAVVVVVIGLAFAHAFTR